MRWRETALAVCLAAHALAATPAFSATFTVTTTADAGAGSLREAILAANASPGFDGIQFAVSGTIALASELPAITETVIVDGGADPLNSHPVVTNAVVKVTLDGTDTIERGLRVMGNEIFIRNLSLVRFRNAAIEIRGNGNAVDGCFIGVLPDGITAARNTFDGISIRDGRANRIGGMGTSTRNLISGNRTGVRISFPATTTIVEDNLFGVDRTGTVRIENEGGIVIGDAIENTIRGNLVSGSLYEGIELAHYAMQNVVEDNVIGLNAAQTAAITNDQHGIKLGAGASDNLVQNNLIAGNRSGIALWDACTSYNRIVGNTIGHATVPNTEYGIELRDAADNVITGNDILFNGFSGISMIVESGAAVPKRNLVRDNDIHDHVGEGINLWLPGNFVEENRIERNRYGVRLRFAVSTANVVEGNEIRDNDEFGVWIQGAEGNEVRDNHMSGQPVGIAHGAGNGDAFRRNLIDASSIAIDLNLDGPTPNDAGDTDDGPNRLQNYPALAAASRTDAATSVSGVLDSLPGTYTVEFFGSATGTDAARFLGARTVTAGVPFAFTDLLPSTEPFVVATATSDATGDTSELSPGIAAPASESIVLPVVPGVRVLDPEGVLYEGDAAVFRITTTASADPITVDYITADETALDGADYAGTSGTVTFAPGETEKTVIVPTINDTTSETTESFVLLLTAATNAEIEDATGRATIRDDDFTLSISDLSIAEGEIGEAVILIDPAPTRPIRVDPFLNNMTAGPDDFHPPPGFVVAPCQTEYRVRIVTLEDLLDEGDEQFGYGIVPERAHVGDDTAIVTILDDDPPPVITIDDASAEEGNTATFVVRLSTPSGLEVRVDAVTVPGTAGAADYTPVTTTVIFPPGFLAQFVNVPTTEDVIDEPDETFSLMLSNPQNGVFGDRTGEATIGDDDLSADLSITKTANVDRARIGDTVEYEVVVTNNGPGPAIDVVVTDTLPAGSTLVSASPSCGGGNVCNVGDLAPGAQATVTFEVVLATTPSVNTATVTAATTDPNAGNDTATAAIAGPEEIPSLSTIGLALMTALLAWVAIRKT